MIGEMGEHRGGDGTDADLDGGTVGNALGDERTDGEVIRCQFVRGNLDQRLMRFNPAGDL
jgi:hypothetical protein